MVEVKFVGQIKCIMGNSKIENNSDKTSQRGKMVHRTIAKTLNDPRHLTSTEPVAFLFSFIFIIAENCQRLSLGSGVRVSPSHCLSSNQRFGSTCSFSCARGYRLSGPTSTQCMKLGVWSRDERTVSCKGLYSNTHSSHFL